MIRSRAIRPPACVLVACVLMAAGAASAQQGPRSRASAVVVLDASNSMNGRLPNDRTSKIAAVAGALRASLPKLTTGTEIGLAAFGARRASDCNDAEVIVPPSADVGRVTAALERIQPRGFSPVVLALRNAAKALPADGSKAGIILVLDDLASCRGEDPCAVAGDLKRQNPALSVHVVVLGPRPVDLPVLACMAKQTGGLLLQVADGAGVAPAVEEALVAASLDARDAQRPAPEAARPGQRPAEASPQAKGPQAPATPSLGIDVTKPGVHLTARLADGMPTLLLPIRWRIWRPAEATAEGGKSGTEAALLHEATAPAITRQLSNGRYEVEASAGLVTVRRALEVTTPGPHPVAVNLDAALLAISAPLAKGAPPPPDASITVLAIGGDSRADSGTPVWVARAGTQDIVVPSGSYRVRALAGLAAAERVATVGRGVVTEIEMPLSAGRLIVEPRGMADGAPAQILLETDDPDASGGRREIHRATGQRLDVSLPAGSYHVTLRRDAAEMRERLLVRPGEVTARELPFTVAKVRLISRIGGGLPPGIAVTYRIERLDVVARPTQSWHEAEPVVDLAPGRYRLEARVGAQNAVATREVEVRVGPGEQRIDVDTASGAIQFKLQGATGSLGLGEVYWQIFDDRGEAVWRTGQAEPAAALKAGRYRVRADYRDRSFERTFDVRGGENRVIEVGG